MKREMTGRLADLLGRSSAFVRRRITVNQAHLARYRNRHTKYVAVSGSSGKTTVCSMLEHILSAVGRTDAQISRNTMPTIAPFVRAVSSECDFAVVEAAIEAVDRMKHLARLIRPDIAVLTMIELEHKKQMPDLDIIAREKGYLVEYMSPSGVAVLNADDERTAGIAKRASGRVVTFGRTAAADYRAVEISARFPDRLSLRICASGLDLRLQTRLVGEHSWLPVTAAVSAAHQLGVPQDVIAQRMASFEPVVGRCSVIELPDDRHFVLDTYKAPQHSLVQAFEIARTARATRRRIVLGQLSDTTGGGTTAYRKAYRLARDCADELVFVGNSAHRHNAPRKDVDSGRIISFEDVREASDYLHRTSLPGEFVLLKSSCSLHLERAGIAQIEAVRCWGDVCRLKTDCTSCGLYQFPYESHFGESALLSE